MEVVTEKPTKHTVHEGYKRTEAGVIPEDWEIRYLGPLSSLIGDGIHSTPNYSESGDYFFINGNNLSNGKIKITEDTKKVDTSEFRKHGKNLNDSTILLSINGTIGNLAYYQGEPVMLGKSAAYINLGPKVLKEYIFYQLQTRNTKNFFENNLTGTTIKNLGLGTIKSTPIPLPPTLEEQRAIAQTLSDVDALIAELDALIEKKQQVKKGAMQQLLTGKKRLAGFDGEWEEKTLEEIGNTYNGLSGKSGADFGDGNHPYIPFLNVMNNPIIDTSHFDSVKIKSGESQSTAEKGDLFFNTSSETPEEVGMCSVLLEDVENLHLNSFCFGLRLFDLNEVVPMFLAYYFRSQYGREHMSSLAQGSTRYNLSKSKFIKIKITLSSYEEQKAIAGILRNMDAEIQALEAKRAKYNQIKQGMMQELLTGKTRLV